MSTAKKTPTTPADAEPPEGVMGDPAPHEAIPADEAPETDESTEPEAEQPAKSHNAEAREWRLKLRAAEAERDDLRGTVEALRQQNVTFLMTDENSTLPRIHKPADLFEIGGVQAGDLTDDAGAIDVAKLTAALEALHAERPYLFAQPEPDPLARFLRQQRSPLDNAPKVTTGSAWGKALSKRS